LTIYVDSSVLLKAYLDEPESERAVDLLLSDAEWVTARHTSIEVRRNLARALKDRAAIEARDQFLRHWETMIVVELDEAVCEAASEIAEVMGIRSLDALHLGAARRLGVGSLPLATFDLRQAQAARSLGWTVLGV
jgi:uncharacterized protein